MKKLVYGFAMTASILGTHATPECPNSLSQDQMKQLADQGSVTIDGVLYTTNDQAKIKQSLPSGINPLTKALGKSAERDYQQMNADSTTSQCFYNFRTYLQKFSREDYVKFSISPPQQSAESSTSVPQQGNQEKKEPMNPSRPVIPTYPQSGYPQHSMGLSLPQQPTTQATPTQQRPVIMPTYPQPGQYPQSGYPQHSMGTYQPQQPTSQPTQRSVMPTYPQSGQYPHSGYPQHSMGTYQPQQPTSQPTQRPVIPTYPQSGQYPQSGYPQHSTGMYQPPHPTSQPTQRPVILTLPQSTQPQHSMEFPQTPRPSSQATPTPSRRVLPTTPQSGQNPRTAQAQQSDNLGTFTYHRDTEGKVITSKFEKQTLGEKGEPYIESKVKDILYIKDKNGKEYLWYDPNLNNQKENKEMMDAYKVTFVAKLEGKSVKFQPTGKTLTIEGKQYELVTAIPTP